MKSENQKNIIIFLSGMFFMSVIMGIGFYKFYLDIKISHKNEIQATKEIRRFRYIPKIYYNENGANLSYYNPFTEKYSYKPYFLVYNPKIKDTNIFQFHFILDEIEKEYVNIYSQKELLIKELKKYTTRNFIILDIDDIKNNNNNNTSYNLGFKWRVYFDSESSLDLKEIEKDFSEIPYLDNIFKININKGLFINPKCGITRPDYLIEMEKRKSNEKVICEEI